MVSKLLKNLLFNVGIFWYHSGLQQPQCIDNMLKEVLLSLVGELFTLPATSHFSGDLTCYKVHANY